MVDDLLWEMHAIFRGRVHGVGFRATAQFHAQKFGLVGTVKNITDDSVEIYAQGKRETLEGFIEVLKVDKGLGDHTLINIDYSEPRRDFEDFTILF